MSGRRRRGWLALVPALAAVVGFGTVHGADSWLQGRLRHSQVALMPEGEPDDVAVLRPLHPGVVAWGTDAVGYLGRPDAMKAHLAAYRDLGVQLLACNVWMLTATPRVLHDDPRFQDAVCRDIAGDPIVPRWLDGDYQGVKSYWGCTNHPLFREQLLARARAGIAAGANLLHLDDHMGTAAAAEHSGGGFCEYCMRGFRAWLRAHRSAAELAAAGITDPDTFDYRTLLRTGGLTTRARYEAAVQDGRVPLRTEFLTFQREAVIGFIGELRAAAAAAAGHPVPVGVNAWNLAPTQLATQHVADYFANEISHYGVEDLNPPRAYLLADALGKPVFSTGTGEDWIEVMDHGDVVRVQRWIATAQAFGEHFMYAWRKWAFSQATGTRWYQTPIATFAPLCDFITAHPALFDDHVAVPQVGVLYDNCARREGRGDVAEILRTLHDAHLSAGLAVAGDAWLQHTLDAAALARFEIVVVPGGVELDGPQKTALDAWRRQGRAIPWRGLDELRSHLEPWIEVSGSGRVWALPRVQAGASTPGLVIQLLNQTEATDRDAMIPSGPLHVTIRSGEKLGGPWRRATLFAPGADPRELSVRSTDTRCEVTVPRVELWSVLQLE